MRNIKYIFSLVLLFIGYTTYAQTEDEIHVMRNEMNIPELESIAKVEAEKYKVNYDLAMYLAQQNGWLLNYEQNGIEYSLVGVDDNNNPIYNCTLGFNSYSRVIKANHVQLGGSLGLNLQGNGIRVGIWDEDKVNGSQIPFETGGLSRIGYGADVLYSTTFSRHSTNVASTLLANSNMGICYGQTLEGVATLASATSYDYGNPTAEMNSEITTNGLLFSNHSYGTPYPYYSNYSNFDNLLDLAPFHSCFMSNGNYWFNQLAKNKNIISVGWIYNTVQPPSPNQWTHAYLSKIPQPFGQMKPHPNGISNVGIPEGGIIAKTVTISADANMFGGADNIISDDKVITVYLDLNHQNVSDLRVYLVGPNNCGTIEVSTNNGGSGDNYVESYFSNINSLDITQASAPFSVQPFKFEGDIYTAPTNLNNQYITLPASALSGCPVVGDWNIYVGDDVVNGITGAIKMVKLGISRMFPTLNLKVRPHIVSVGNITVLNENGSVQCETTGTSFSSPSATGGGVLLQQLYKDYGYPNFMRSTSLKGLMIHTAKDAGKPGPDFAYGYGVLYLEVAARHIINNGLKTEIIEENLANNGTYTYTLTSDGITPIKATLCWLEPESSNSQLINDLDLRITTPNGTEYPWKINSLNINDGAIKGDNTIDEVEQVEITNPQLGATYTITVSHKNTLSDGTNSVSSRPFSLIFSGSNNCGINDPVDLTMSNPINANMYSYEHASNSITANNVLNATSMVKYVGGNEVLMTAGFDGLLNSSYDALIGDCVAAGLNKTNKTDITQLIEKLLYLIIRVNKCYKMKR